MNNSKLSSFGECSSEHHPSFLPTTRKRLKYTHYQLDLLNGIFYYIRYPNSIQKEIIAKRVAITRNQVKAWFQNRRRKEVIIKERSNHKTFSKNPEIPTASGFSSIPSVILVSIVEELKHFGEKEKVKQKAECKRNLQLSSCQSSPSKSTENQTFLKSELTNSISKKHSIYFSAFDIKSPPNQITPTVAFNLRSDRYRGPFEVFSTEKLKQMNSLVTLERRQQDSFQFSCRNQSMENLSLSSVGTSFVPSRMQPFSYYSSIMPTNSYSATNLIPQNETNQSPFLYSFYSPRTIASNFNMQHH